MFSTKKEVASGSSMSLLSIQKISHRSHTSGALDAGFVLSQAPFLRTLRDLELCIQQLPLVLRAVYTARTTATYLTTRGGAAASWSDVFDHWRRGCRCWLYSTTGVVVRLLRGVKTTYSTIVFRTLLVLTRCTRREALVLRVLVPEWYRQRPCRLSGTVELG